MLEKEIMQYKTGGLLYMPVFKRNVVEKIAGGSFPRLSAAAFCLEDAIKDESLEEAEASLKIILRELEGLDEKILPLIFVRVRSPQHLQTFHDKIGSHAKVLTGYIFPKFDTGNAEDFIAVSRDINRGRSTPLYIIPTFESDLVANIFTRQAELAALKKILDAAQDIVLNIHIGTNDFCNLYGLRRQLNQTVYDIGIVRDVLIDILNVFSKDFVVAGGVYNFFGSAGTAGLKRELELDRANGFVGKPAIHPAQLPVILDSLKVTQNDLDDAKLLLDWQSSTQGVMKSADGSRMNEVKCHQAWARRIQILGELYGVTQ